MTEGRDPDAWHVTKVISVGDIVSIIVALGAVAAAYASLNSRVAVLESGATRAIADVAEIKTEMKELNRKLDQFLIRQSQAGDHR